MSSLCLLPRALSSADVASLDLLRDHNAVRVVLEQMLITPEQDGAHFKTKTMVEFFLHLVSFCRAQNFASIQLQVALSLFKSTHAQVEAGFLSMHQTFAYFQSQLLAHSVHRPPHSISVFTLAQASSLTDFALENYFRFFKLFRCVFTMKYVKDVTVHTSHFQLPPSPFLPLSDAVPTISSTSPSGESTAQGVGEQNVLADDEEVLAGEEDASPLDADATAALTEESCGSHELNVAPASGSGMTLDDASSPFPPGLSEAMRAQLDAQVAAMRVQLEKQQAQTLDKLERTVAELQLAKR